MRSDLVKIGENDFTKVEIFLCYRTRTAYVLRRGSKVAEKKQVNKEEIEKLKKELL